MALAVTELPSATSPCVDELMQEASEYLGAAALEQLHRAYDYAASAHEGQMRKSGEPYVVHLVATAYYLAALRLDVTTLIAALLHDTIEDTSVTHADLEGEFGPAVARIVEGVSKFGEIGHRHRRWEAEQPEELRRQRNERLKQQAENVRKMFLAMAEDPRVVIVKLADRLHNMRTLDFQPAEKQRRIALDTREIYAPLAGRLGIYQLKTPLEDLAFKYLEPADYRWLADQIAEERSSRSAYIGTMSDQLQTELTTHGIEAEVKGRAKHLYSIYKKLLKPNVEMNLDRVYDVFALRVIVPSISECYQVLGLVHSLWRPFPNRVKDYIAAPKQNGYRSLHTTVYGNDLRAVEIQIRTREMHEVAEYGVATHWYYKEQGKSAALPQHLAEWIQALVSWQDELNPDAVEFVDTLKMDQFSGQVFVLSPRGDVIDLPAGSTPIDFAYRIHTELGHRTIGAKVNGLMVPLDTDLQTGDRVEILTTKTAHGPSRDWLSFVRSANARQKIRQWFRKQSREDNIARGKELLDTELHKLGHGSIKDLGTGVINDLLSELNLRTADDMFAQLGYGALTIHPILNHLGVLESEEEIIPQFTPPQPPTSGEVRVMGVGNVLTRMANDCRPAPGDEIIGYITRNRGVTVHRADCPRIQSEKERERLVEVDWGPQDVRQVYPVSVVITAWDRAGLLRDITTAVADMHVNMAAVHADTHSDGSATVTAILGVASIDQLTDVFARLERVKGVQEVRREGRRQNRKAQTA